MRWTWPCRQTNGVVRGRRKRVVLMPRRWHHTWRQRFAHCAETVARKPDSPGRARHRPLKPFACGNAGFSGELVVANSCAFFICTRGCGCVGTRHSPRPLGAEGFGINPGGKPSRGGGGVPAFRSSSPGCAERRRPGIHGAATTLGEMDSGRALTRPGMTKERVAMTQAV